MLVLVVLGPAGSGKSTLVAAYSRWLAEGGARVVTVSLDPAAERLPYKPDIDVRRFVDAREVAEKYGLGPNGALVKSMELIAERLGDILGPLRETEADYVLVDTPGQMEVFLFRDVSWKLTGELQRISPETYGLFVMDATVLHDPADYAFLAVLATAVELRLGVVTAPVLNKADEARGLEARGDIVRDFGRVAARLRSSGSLYAEMLRDMLRVLMKYRGAVEVPRVSALRGEGMEELHRLVLEMGCSCGDLT